MAVTGIVMTVALELVACGAHEPRLTGAEAALTTTSSTTTTTEPPTTVPPTTEAPTTLPPVTEPPSTEPPPVPAPTGTGTLSGAARRRADQMVSCFENSTPTIQYSYIEALGDGRGYTAGRAGFTSATGDLLEVVQKYVAAVSSSPLAAYLPRLQQLSDSGSGSTSGLSGFDTAWKAAAADAKMRAAQDAVVNELYFNPAIRRGKAAGVRHALTFAAIYDTIIQHGEGSDPDGLPRIISETNSAMGGSPAGGVDEVAWLRKFLAVRRNHLAHAADPSTRREWAESVDRVDALVRVLDGGNLDLDHGFTLTVYGDSFNLA